jgi:hypothetical protein
MHSFPVIRYKHNGITAPKLNVVLVNAFEVCDTFICLLNKAESITALLVLREKCLDSYRL